MRGASPCPTGLLRRFAPRNDVGSTRLAGQCASGHICPTPSVNSRDAKARTTDAATRLTSAISDRYLIERELGAGGMATVYLAKTRSVVAERDFL